VSQLSTPDALSIGFIAILISMLVALPVTIIVTLAVIRRFQKRVADSMQATAGALEKPVFVERRASGTALGELSMEKINAMSDRRRPAPAVRLFTTALQHERKLAAIFVMAACVHSLILAAIFALPTLSVHKLPAGNPIAALIRLYGFFFVISATPVALAGTLILTKQLRFLALTVLVLIAVLWGLGGTIRSSDPLGLWLMIAGLPTGVVLLLNARRLRSVGPIVFAATLLLFSTIVAGVCYGAFFASDFIGPVHFVREDLARLPFPTAVSKYFQDSSSISVAIETIVNHTSSVIRADHAERLTTGYKLLIAALSLITILIGAAFGWGFVRRLAAHYRDRRASDQMLSIDVLMSIFTITTSLILFFPFGVTAAMCVVAGFFGYNLLAHLQLRIKIGDTPQERAFTLLLLRVFRAKRRGQVLLERILHHWRYIGPVRLIAGTDFADSLIEPHEFFEFLCGQLSRAFVRDRKDLEHRLSQLLPKPDPDGLYRIEDFFCHLDTWQMTVASLAKQADVVLMDLRGFTSAHRGCVFEIEMLLDSFPVNRIVFLIDNFTDQVNLEETLRLVKRGRTSPAEDAGMNQIALVQAASDSRTIDCLLHLLCEKARLSLTVLE
jgi:hypothetical protein